MKKLTLRHITTAAAVGAVYAVLSIFGSVFGITFGTVQCRFSEALCCLALLFPGDGVGPVRGLPADQSPQPLRPGGYHRGLC